MEASRKELLVARIMAGCLRCKVSTESGEIVLAIRKPPLEQLYVAQELYQSYLKELISMNCLTEEQMLDYMIDNGLWSLEEQKILDDMVKNIEEFKVKLYQFAFKANEKKKALKALQKSKDVLNELTQKKQAYNYLTCTGAASLIRTRYLVAMSLYYLNGKPVYTEDTFWDSTTDLLDQVLEFYFANRITETEYREIARTDPWRSVWNSKKAEGQLFGIPCVDLSEEQRNLTIWSGIYDSVYEHPECPLDSVIEDDDILDGWMILQRRKREFDAEKKRGETLVENENIRNMGEIFVPVDTLEDAKKLTSTANDDQANMIRRKRMAIVRAKGKVHEAEMPDAQLEIQQQLNQKFMDAARGK